MNELTFIIINSRESLSRLMIDELKSRVSFPVYQDNVGDDIWNLLKGGKDDMYIYDRCGRLTFYIPFPLSIIHPQQPIVSASIHATYHEKICGDSCMMTEPDSFLPSDYQQSLDDSSVGGNITNTLDEEDIKEVLSEENNIHNDSTLAVDDVEDEFSFLLHLNDSEATNNETIQDKTNDLDTFNETLIFFDLINGSLVNRLSDNITEFPGYMTEFTDINVTSVLNTTDVPINGTGKVHAIQKGGGGSFWDKAYDLFLLNTTFEQHLATTEKNPTDVEPTVKGRCNDPSYRLICLEWSKKKLWRVNFCCNSNHENNITNAHTHCGHYKAKKCKKLQPILKCCLSTAVAPTESSLSYQRTTSQEHFATVG